MINQIECFVTFCEADASIEHVKQLVKQLRIRTGNTVKYHVYDEMSYGDSLNVFMSNILANSGAILGLFGPEYKKRVETSQQHTGAWREFNQIVDRFEDPDNYVFPNLVPIHWAGDNVSSALPEYILMQNPFACDLSLLRAFESKNAGWAFPKAYLDKYKSKIDKIAEDIIRNIELQNAKVIEIKKQHLHELLLPTQNQQNIRNQSIREVLEIKYEHGDYDAQQFKDRFFTKTRFFRELKGKNVGLISGRKGSGKSTLVDIRELEARTENYFPVIDIEVDGWNLHAIIQRNTYRQAESDFEYVDVDVKFFDFVWAAFSALCICCSLLESGKEEGISPSDLLNNEAVIEDLIKLIETAKAPTEINYGQLFLLATKTARAFIQNAVDEARSDTEEDFIFDVIGSVSVKLFMFSQFGNDLILLTDVIERLGKKRFLFCFDRFDQEIQSYRKDYEHSPIGMRQMQAKREIDWLSSLTMFVEKTIRPDGPEEDLQIYEFFNCVKFLVVLPHDRVLEIRNSQRDAIASESIDEIRWQPKELLTMLRKRMQALYDIPDNALDKNKYKTPLQRFERVKALSCKKLPRDVYISIGSKKFEIELFLDVLRHSFFRPRDILIHYAAILSYYDTMIMRDRPIDIEALRVAISSETRTIVKSEFIGELRDTWINIDDILQEFQGRDQVMAKRDLESIIGPLKFKFYDDSIKPKSLAEKIDFLYNVGFLGFRSTRPVGSHRNQIDFTFSFFATSTPPSFAAEEIVNHLDFAIHPIFIETLYLHVNATTPVINFSWDTLNQIDRL